MTVFAPILFGVASDQLICSAEHELHYFHVDNLLWARTPRELLQTRARSECFSIILMEGRRDANRHFASGHKPRPANARGRIFRTPGTYHN